MGTYYSFGIIKNFSVQANQELAFNEWVATLDDRIDLECFDLNRMEKGLEGALRESIFHDNIADFYTVLRSILGQNRNGNIDYYETTFGTDINNYQTEYANIQFKNKANVNIDIHMTFAMLFIEGKVLAEEFYTEPILLNWLFRNSTIKNKLAGCIVSNIIG